MTIECSQSVHSIDIRPVYYGVQMVICGGKSRFHSVSTWFLGIEYYGAAEPPVRCGESHLSGLTEPLRSL